MGGAIPAISIPVPRVPVERPSRKEEAPVTEEVKK